ncbi:MAG TPA: GAF domain-containing protein [Candidatus Acidoferrales bacterium]|nr:GAF domain-containing protein [Candidatus Acidoferrales bacterium]
MEFSAGNGFAGMAEKQLQHIVEQAVAQVLDRHLPKLQSELVERVLEALPQPPAETPPPAEPSAASLVQAISGIHAGGTQKEILRALLDSSSASASRVALFVVRSGAANGWQSRGLGEDETVKDLPLDMSGGPIAHAYQNRVVTPGNIAEMDARFVERFGGPANEQILILPLVLKDKVAALLYADGGANGILDSAALEVLVLATSAWLEVVSLRKQAQKEGPETSAAAALERPAFAPPLQTVSSFADPFAAHAPQHTAAQTAEPEPAAEVVEVVAHAAAASAAASAPAAAADPFAGLAPEDADTHRKAQRFARLLVDEIKLYNQAKVTEGRRNKDLYDRLKDDIEKSRASYQKRYGNTIAAGGDYFQKEILRSLAEEDASLMGANFRR